MDGSAFDQLARSLTNQRSRRGLGQMLGGLAVGGPLVALGAAEAGAKKKKKKKKKKDKDKDGCKQNCGGGTLCCGESCVDVTRDRNNCGACGTQCLTGQYCINATCVPCEDPYALCTSLGVERCVDLRSDPKNCGSCEFPCSVDPTTPARNFICENKLCICTGNICADGRCCPSGFSICNAGGGCCPDGFPTFCPGNGKCCPAGYTCGGNCGQDCCQP